MGKSRTYGQFCESKDCTNERKPNITTRRSNTKYMQTHKFKYCDPCLSLLRKYKIDYPTKLKMCYEQNNKCYICKRKFDFSKPKTIHVDHCHGTNKIRKILCSRCNTTLGVYKEDIKMFKRFIDYIVQHTD